MDFLRVNMSTLNFKIDMLEWAANNIGLRLDEVVSRISEAERTQKKLLEGKFSIKQAEDFAEITKVPFGTLFLQQPPQKIYRPSIPDLRQKPDPLPLSDLFYEVLEDIQNKQAWYIEYLKDNGAEELEFVGKFSNMMNANADTIANDIRKTLGLPLNLRAKTNRENYLKLLIQKCEDAGILVFKNSIVKNSTKKQLDSNEFRGFVLIDKLAPAIFLNGQDMPSGIIFTLAHELAHIWLGESGVDDLDIYGNNPNEVFCNKIAASVLISYKEFTDAWKKFDKQLIEIANHFYVSKLMVARLALTYGCIDEKDYRVIHTQEIDYYQNQPKKDGNPSFMNLVPGRNSYLLTKTIVNQAISGNVLLRDASRLLNASPHTILKLGGL